jgi:hypothetical protein
MRNTSMVVQNSSRPNLPVPFGRAGVYKPAGRLHGPAATKVQRVQSTPLTHENNNPPEPMSSETATLPPLFSAADLRRIRAFVSNQLDLLPVDRAADPQEDGALHSSLGRDAVADGREPDDPDEAKLSPRTATTD